MANIKDQLGKAIGGSEIFNKTVDYLGDKQRLFKTKNALDEAKGKLAALFDELGKVSYYKKPLVQGRTSTVIREEISITLKNVEELQKAYDDMTSTKAE